MIFNFVSNNLGFGFWFGIFESTKQKSLKKGLDMVERYPSKTTFFYGRTDRRTEWYAMATADRVNKK